MADEYPTDEELEIIKNWDFQKGWKPLIEYVESIWWMPDWGFKVYKGRDHLFHNERVTKVELHTGGWSGNESIIDALQHNYLFWSLSFYKEICGGHYTFEIRCSEWIGKWKDSPINRRERPR